MVLLFIGQSAGEQIHLSAFSFVDDSMDIIQTQDEYFRGETPDLNQRTIQCLFDKTQKASNLWSQSLAATGGALEGSKTFCVPMISEWKGDHMILSSNDGGRQLFLTKPDGSSQIIAKRNPSDSFFTLGIWQSLSGDDTEQKQYLIHTVKAWGQKTSINKISWTHARIAMTSMIGRTLTYSLPATAMGTGQCREIQQAYLQAMLLGKIGVVRTTPALLACAPTAVGGLGMLSFEIEQLVQHIAVLL
jgi:hypothetical protein